MSSWHVYILRCSDGTLYCGITNDLPRRLAQHNAGTASKYTRSRIPVSLEKAVEVSDKSAALKLEIQVKKQKARDKLRYLDLHHINTIAKPAPHKETRLANSDKSG